MNILKEKLNTIFDVLLTSYFLVLTLSIYLEIIKPGFMTTWVTFDTIIYQIIVICLCYILASKYTDYRASWLIIPFYIFTFFVLTAQTIKPNSTFGLLLALPIFLIFIALLNSFKLVEHLSLKRPTLLSSFSIVFLTSLILSLLLIGNMVVYVPKKFTPLINVNLDKADNSVINSPLIIKDLKPYWLITNNINSFSYTVTDIYESANITIKFQSSTPSNIRIIGASNTSPRIITPESIKIHYMFDDNNQYEQIETPYNIDDVIVYKSKDIEASYPPLELLISEYDLLKIKSNLKVLFIKQFQQKVTKDITTSILPDDSYYIILPTREYVLANTTDLEFDGTYYYLSFTEKMPTSSRTIYQPYSFALTLTTSDNNQWAIVEEIRLNFTRKPTDFSKIVPYIESFFD